MHSPVLNSWKSMSYCWKIQNILNLLGDNMANSCVEFPKNESMQTITYSSSQFYAIAANQWLQFDVGPPTLITGLVTKGRADTRRKHWVTRFRVSYSNDSKVWYYYKDASHLDPKVMYYINFIWIISML